MTLREWERRSEILPVWKALKLISARKAVELGVNTEAPVFVSSMVEKKETCEDCGREYAPLAYIVGRRVKAHHFHPPGQGGIYRMVSGINLEDFERTWGNKFYGWVGLLGMKSSSWECTIEQVASSRVVGVKAFCGFHGKHEELQEGYVLERDDVLFPMCSDLFQRGYANVAQIFRVEEGQVLFSQI